MNDDILRGFVAIQAGHISGINKSSIYHKNIKNSSIRKVYWNAKKLIKLHLEEVLLVHAAAAAFGLHIDAVAHQGEPEGIALPHKQFAQHRGTVAGKGELVGLADVALPFDGEQHGAAVVHHELAA